MIKKEINKDNSFGGNYPEDINYSTSPQNYILITDEQRDYIDTNIDKLI